MTEQQIDQMTHDLRICEAGPRLLRSCKELLVAVDAAMTVFRQCRDLEITGRWADALHAQGITPGFGYRAQQVIADAEGTPRPSIVLDPEPDPA